MSKGSGRNIFLLAGAFAGMGLSAHANTSTWNGGTADWNTTGSWTGGIPAPADTAAFGGTVASTATISTGATATSIGAISISNTSTTLIEGGTVASTLSIGSGITIASGAGAVTIGGAGVNALTIALNGSQSWTNSSSNFLTVQSNITNVGNLTPYTLSVNGTKGTTFNGIISDGGSTGTTALNLNGSATVTLVGANTYSGGTTISSGTTELENATALGSGTVTISGGTIDNGLSGAVLTMTANNPIDVNGSFTFAGTAHSLDLGAGNVLFTNNDTLTLNGAVNLALAGNIAFAATTTTLTKTGNSSLLFGHIAGVGAGTWTGASTNTLTVSGGDVEFDMANGSNINSNIVNNGTSAGGLQGIEASGITNTFSGSITGSDSAGVFDQTGVGTSILTGSITGGVTLAIGTIQLGNGANSVSIGGLSSGAMVLPSIVSGSTLAFDQTTGTTIPRTSRKRAPWRAPREPASPTPFPVRFPAPAVSLKPVRAPRCCRVRRTAIPERPRCQLVLSASPAATPAAAVTRWARRAP
jgi:fibronectin-binding autotransporter adhesin